MLKHGAKPNILLWLCVSTVGGCFVCVGRGGGGGVGGVFNLKLAP